MNHFFIVSGLIILVFLASLSLAEIPKMINYQGMLTDDLGDPLNGNPDITFRIFDASSGGNKKWEETHSGVTVTKGLFNVILGSVNPIDTLSFTQEYWLEVQVDNDTMPRIQFTSVAYAFRSEFADTSDHCWTISDGDWAIQDTNIYRVEGNVGIGTDNPGAKLHIVGGELHINSAQIGGYYSRIDGNEISGGMIGPPGSHHLHIKPGDNTSNILLAEDGGNVGIGGAPTASKFAVIGLAATGAGYPPVLYNISTGDFYRVTKSKRYREDIQPWEDDWYKIFQAEPRSFVDKASGQREIGYIAEEFDEIGLGNLVIHDQEGKPDGLRDELISLYLLEIVKDLKAENEELKKRIEALETK